MRGVLEIAILAGTGVLASGKVCKEAKASLVVQPYGSASSPSLAASCAISPVRARSCGTGKRAGRAKPAGASERCQPRASGHTTLEKILYTFRVRQTGAIAGETLYIYTRSVLIMMIVTAPMMRELGSLSGRISVARFNRRLHSALMRWSGFPRTSGERRHGRRVPHR
jgi:hypothetical protein